MRAMEKKTTIYRASISGLEPRANTPWRKEVMHATNKPESITALAAILPMEHPDLMTKMKCNISERMNAGPIILNNGTKARLTSCNVISFAQSRAMHKENDETPRVIRGRNILQ